MLLNKNIGGIYMNNYTIDLYELKREIVNFSKKISKDCIAKVNSTPILIKMEFSW